MIANGLLVKCVGRFVKVYTSEFDEDFNGSTNTSTYATKTDLNNKVKIVRW